jgi:hypothetical protein
MIFFLFDAYPLVYIVINNLISIVIHTTYFFILYSCLHIKMTCFLNGLLCRGLDYDIKCKFDKDCGFYCGECLIQYSEKLFLIVCSVISVV